MGQRATVLRCSVMPHNASSARAIRPVKPGSTTSAAKRGSRKPPPAVPEAPVEPIAQACDRLDIPSELYEELDLQDARETGLVGEVRLLARKELQRSDTIAGRAQAVRFRAELVEARIAARHPATARREAGADGRGEPDPRSPTVVRADLE